MDRNNYMWLHVSNRADHNLRDRFPLLPEKYIHRTLLAANNLKPGTFSLRLFPYVVINCPLKWTSGLHPQKQHFHLENKI